MASTLARRLRTAAPRMPYHSRPWSPAAPRLSLHRACSTLCLSQHTRQVHLKQPIHGIPESSKPTNLTHVVCSNSYWDRLSRLGRIIITGGMAIIAGCCLVAVWISDMLFLLVTWPWDRHRMVFGRFFRGTLGFVVLDLNPLWGCELLPGDIPKERPGGNRVVFVCNHTSYADVVLLSARLPWEMKYLSMGTMRSVPLLGQLMSAAGDVFVHFIRNAEGRWQAVNGEQAMAECKALVEQGVPICIFPEGGLSRTRDLKPFKDGAFKIAVETGAEVVPIALSGAAQMLPPEQLIMECAVGRVMVGESFSTQGMTVSEARDTARQRIQQMIDQLEKRNQQQHPTQQLQLAC